MSRWPAVLLVAFALVMGARSLVAAEPEARSSEAPVDVDEAWTELGFRLRLRFGYHAATGGRRARPPSAASVSASTPVFA